MLRIAHFRKTSRALLPHLQAAVFGYQQNQHRFRSKKAEMLAKQREEAGEPPIDEWAYNHIEKKDGLFKPPHTVEEQIAYMNSEIFERTYQGLPIYYWYRRNFPSQFICQGKPRLFCIDKNGRYNVNHACPICRDEYLFFDYRNPKLIEMFMREGTDQPRAILTTGLCREQYIMLKAQLLKAKEYGTIPFSVEFRYFNYMDWYPSSWLSTRKDDEVMLDPIKYSRKHASIEDVHANPDVLFSTHNRDMNTDWDEWWIRHDKFAKKAK